MVTRLDLTVNFLPIQPRVDHPWVDGRRKNILYKYRRDIYYELQDFKGEEIHNKMENGIKVGPDGQFTIIQTHLPNMYQRGLELASQDCDTRTLTTTLLS